MHYNSMATHAPVASDSSLMELLSMVVRHDLYLKHMDKKDIIPQIASR